jgi:hypothetical protein
MSDYYQTLFNDANPSRFPNYRSVNRIVEHQSQPRCLRNEQQPQYIQSQFVDPVNFVHPLRVQQHHGFNQITNSYFNPQEQIQQPTLELNEDAPMIRNPRPQLPRTPYYEIPNVVAPTPAIVPVQEGFTINSFCGKKYNITFQDIAVIIIFCISFYLSWQIWTSNKKINKTIEELKNVTQITTQNTNK